MKYLIITQVKFWLNRQGCDRVINDRFNLFGGEKELVFIGTLNKNDKRILSEYNIKVVTIYPISFIFVRYLRFFLSKINLNIFYSLKRPFKFSWFARNKIKHICIKEKVDVAIVEYVWLAHLADNIPNNVVKVIDTHDVQHQFCENYIKTNKDWKVFIKKDEEMELYSKFDYVIALSTGDYNYFSQYINNTYYLPPSYKTNSFIPLKRNGLNVGFIAGSAPFNRDAIVWFIDNVLPHVNNTMLNVYGTVCKSLSPTENVNLVGPVEDVSEVYKNNHLMINPTFMTGGIKIKNLEALSYGKMVLTTSYGLRGFEDFEKLGYVRVYDEPREYIDFLNKHNKDENYFNEIGSDIIKAFDKHFSPKNNIVFEQVLEKKLKNIRL